MAIVSMTEAARMVGTSRVTLWRRAKAGVLSTTTAPDGSPGIDTAELFRVFPRETDIEAQAIHEETAAKLLEQAQVDRLRVLELAVDHLKELLIQKDRLIEGKDQTIEVQAQALRLLEHRHVETVVGAGPAEDQAVRAFLEAERTRAAALEAELAAERSRGFFSRLFGRRL